MSDHDKLIGEQLDELERFIFYAEGIDGVDDNETVMSKSRIRQFTTLIAELRALRKLREEVEPVLRFYGGEDDEYGWNPYDDGYVLRDGGKQARKLLARHYDKKEPK